MSNGDGEALLSKNRRVQLINEILRKERLLQDSYSVLKSRELN